MEQIAPEVDELMVGGDPERDSDAMVVMAAEGGGGEPDIDSAEEELQGNTVFCTQVNSATFTLRCPQT